MKSWDRAARGLGIFLAAVGFAAFLFALLLTFTQSVGTDWKLYEKLQTRYGAHEENMEALDRALAAYLKGDSNALLDTGAFGAKELSHMEDVFALFVYLRKLRAGLMAAAAVLVAAGLWLHGPGRQRAARTAALLADAALALTLMGFGLWALMDFNALFLAFHRAVFQNNLWLLDPATDVLIRICPENMFRDMALRIGGYTLLAAACLPALLSVPRNCLPGRNENGLRT